MTGDATAGEGESVGPVETRRGLLGTVFMGIGLVVSHAVALGFAARFLYPVSKKRVQKMFVGHKSRMPQGSAHAFKTPAGQSINIVHGRDGFIALSDICPHLGCRVYWDGVKSEFICPCHNGHFASDGTPISGPPKDMNAPLPTFEVEVEGDSVYLNVPVLS